MSPLAQRTVALLATALLLTVGLPTGHAQADSRHAAPAAAAVGDATLDLIPTITKVGINDLGKLVASGNVTAVVRGKTITAPFDNIPVTIGRAADQTGAPAGCSILDLELAPINLNLLGLLVETSPICLKITAYEGAGLLGDLLCSLSGALDGTTPLETVIGALNVGDRALLLGVLPELLNSALDNLLGAALTQVTDQNGRICSVLDLSLGPVDLTLLGLNVHLDDCDNGPVTVTISAQKGQLLGNILCKLLHKDTIPANALLSAIQDAILGRLNR